MFTGGTLNNHGVLNLSNRSLLTTAHTVDFVLGSATAGTLNLLAGGTLNIYNRVRNETGHTLINSGTISNQASLFNNGTLNNTNVLNNSGQLYIGGALINSGTLNNTGRLDLNFGGIFGAGGSGQYGGFYNNFTGGTLNNTGTLNVGTFTFGATTSGTVNLNAGGNLVSNSSAGLINLADHTQSNAGSIRSALRNEGTWDNLAGATMTGVRLTNWIGATLNNVGTLSMDGINNFGTLNNSGTVTGSLAGSVVNNSGILNNSGTLNADGKLNNYGGLTNTGTLAVSGGLYLRSGNIDNAGTMTLTSASTYTISATSTLTNTGTLNLYRNFRFWGKGPITIVDGEIQEHFNYGTVNLNAGGILNNFATLSNDAGHTQANAGTLNNLLGATLTNNGSFSNSGTFTNSGTVNGSGTFTQTAGVTQIDGSFTQSQIDIQSGTLSGSGTVHGDVTNSGGTVGPGNSPGILSIDGDFTQGSDGIFNVEIGGLLAVTEYDVLSVTGTAYLDGTLAVDLFDLGGGLFNPLLGDSFNILTAETVSGSFSSLDLAVLTGGLGWHVDYLTDFIGTTDVVRLNVVTAVPIPPAAIQMLSGLGFLGWIARRKKKLARVAA